MPVRLALRLFAGGRIRNSAGSLQLKPPSGTAPVCRVRQPESLVSLFRRSRHVFDLEHRPELGGACEFVADGWEIELEWAPFVDARQRRSFLPQLFYLTHSYTRPISPLSLSCLTARSLLSHQIYEDSDMIKAMYELALHTKMTDFQLDLYKETINVSAETAVEEPPGA